MKMKKRKSTRLEEVTVKRKSSEDCKNCKGCKNGDGEISLRALVNCKRRANKKGIQWQIVVLTMKRRIVVRNHNKKNVQVRDEREVLREVKCASRETRNASEGSKLGK